MTVKIIKDNTIPSTWKRLQTKEHRYIIIMYGGIGKLTRYEVYHSDDCTLNNRIFLFEVNGSIEKVKLSIGKYEEEQNLLQKDKSTLDSFCRIEVAQ